VRVEAAPINPSDLGLLLAGADVSAAAWSGQAGRPVVTMPLPDGVMRAAKGRVGVPMPAGNEGAGTVVAAGSAEAARALLGKTVAVAGGAMYAEYRCVDAALCMQLPEGTRPADGASSFVNPMTALGMVETMRLENHVGLVHTAAASNLGQMLNRLCIAEQVPLVSIVRKREQEELLRSAGATYVCNSTSEAFMADLTAALSATAATLAFDAVGGGRLASQILTCMEAAVTASATSYSRYGSAVHKQVYIYGSLDRGPTELARNFGMAWGVGSWLLTPFLSKIGPDGVDRLRRRVAAGLTTTFASGYTNQVSLGGMLAPDALADYARQATGSKYLVVPSLAL
jgi:NADPH:quinone reductase-like Zn-dependent oxidoreductase